MAYREVSRVEIAEVVRRWQSGMSQRQIATGTGLSRATVRRHIDAAVEAGLARDGPAPSEEQLTRLAGLSVAGPRRVETPTGEMLAPWAEQIYEWLTADRLQLTRVDVIEGLEAAWAFFEGVPNYLVIDNFPAAVAGVDPLHPRLTRGFLEYSQHRGFISDPARVRHPRDKPRVERGVPYVRERFFKGGEFTGLADMRSAARRWCLEVAGQRVHGTTRRQPLAVFRQEERHALGEWDAEPYEMTGWRTAKVHPGHHIACQYALYPVPSAACPPGQKAEVRLGSKLVRIYHRGRLIKVHPRQGRGGRSTDPGDYPSELSAYTLRAPEQIKRSAASQGPAVAAYAERLFDGPLPWAKLRQGHKLIRLGERYSPERLDAACRRALSVDLIDVRRLERILFEALEQEATQPEPPPMPPGRFAKPGAVFARANGRTAHSAQGERP